GFKDILPAEAACWRHLEKTARETFAHFGFGEVRPPVMEKADLFKKSIGEATDIVEKEMYTFTDRSGESITLRPEATASVVRAYIQHKLYADNPVRKLYTMGPMFRRERPQKGRYRQFHQINAEVFGIASPYMDARLILMLTTLLERLSVGNVDIHINSLGCRQCRPSYKEALGAFLEKQAGELCPDCRQRIGRNPLRALDCKVDRCRKIAAGAPALTDHLCSGCDEHFETVTGLLRDLGITFIVDKFLVRGLDYYTRTTFEVQTADLGAQNAIAGGGRYDDLVRLMGGPDQPAVGFAIGCERLIEIISRTIQLPAGGMDLFIAAIGPSAREKAFSWLCRLNRAGLCAEMQFDDKSLKSQMKQADRAGAGRVLIVGDAELDAGRALLRNMATKEQQKIPLDNITDRLMEIIPGPGEE
ncbi:MAG: histidine--tRNA ligase, partial [Desulfosudaceae bacterium]